VQLGALGWFLFWIVTVSGIYVYIFFDTGVTQAYSSLEYLSREQPFLGGIMRSLHRYASDALVVVAVVHLLREFSLDRLRSNRWFAWLTGLPLLWFIYACGITGYWLVWDELAQYVAIATSEWLDSLGIFGEPIAGNFLTNSHLSGRFFTLMVYIHIAVPLLMLLFMWVHIQRHARARVNPARKLGVATLGMLVALALVEPAMSQAPANLDRFPFEIGLDWFYLAAYPLVEFVDGKWLWAGVVAGTLLLACLPWIPPLRRAPAAIVHLDNCNGCMRCFADCPFGAITMVARSDGAPFAQQAEVDTSQCVSCGICVGACPTATPFRRASALVPGIELPAHRLADLREQIVAAAASLHGDARVLMFSCAHAGDVARLTDGGVGLVPLPCVGMLPPSFIDFVISRHHADGVFIAGCAANACFERLGNRFTQERIVRTRDPQLRERVARDRITLSWEAAVDLERRRVALSAFRGHLRQRAAMPAADTTRGAAGTACEAWQAVLGHWNVSARAIGQALALAALALLIGWFSTRPSYAWLGRDQAVVKLSFSHAGQPLKPCRRYRAEELARLPFNERSATNCERGRWPVYLEVDLDGRSMHRGTHRAAGLWDDGPSTVYLRLSVPAGTHRFDARLRDSGRGEGFDSTATSTVTLVPGQSFVIDYRGSEGGFRFGTARDRGSSPGSTAE
jgi:ferredoxin/coenzyme F420-reducing hydrogenase delta subunit